MPLTAGTRLGPYEIVSPLGAGGMGEVYRAKDTRLGRDVAIKVLPAHLNDQPEVRARFEREAKTVSSLNHPNICTLFDVGREGETDYLVMELVDGETLADRLHRGALPLPEVLRIGGQVADALDRAHRAGVIHRDLKPGNIMLTRSGAKLMDFGLARATGLGGPASGSAATMAALTRSPTVAQPLTAEGTIVGTFQYMAPEQLEGKEADARADIWAFGCVLFEMATGKRAFDAPSQASLIAAIMHLSPPAVSQVVPLTPPGLDRLVAACLAKDPADRLQSAHDLKLQLGWLGEGASTMSGSMAGMALPSSGGMTAPPAAARRPPLTGLVIVALATALVSALVTGALRTPAKAVPGKVQRFSLGAANLITLSAPMFTIDGESVIFTAREGGLQRLYRRKLSSYEITPIEGTEEGAAPFLSPDGAWIGFLTPSAIRKVPIDGGVAQTIASTFRLSSADWGSDGTIWCCPRFGGEKGDVAMYKVPATGGSLVVVARLDSTQKDGEAFLPEVLPDGKHVLFSMNHSGGQGWTLESIALDGSRKKVIDNAVMGRYVPSGRLVYYDNGSNAVLAAPFDPVKVEVTGPAVPLTERADGMFCFDVSGDRGIVYIPIPGAEDGNSLVWLDRQGRSITAAEMKANWTRPRISPDGKRAFIRKVGESCELWMLDLERGSLTRALQAGDNHDACWGPDGRQIAVEQMSPSPRMVTVTVEGPREQHLLDEGALAGAPLSWSIDNLIAYTRAGVGTASDIWIRPVGGPEPTAPFVAGTANEADPSFSPDGHWLAYSSNEGGQSDVFVRRVPDDGSSWQISTGSGTSPLWSRDGKHLYFVDGTKMMSVAVERGNTLRIGTPVMLFDGGFNVERSREFDEAPDGRFLAIQRSGTNGGRREIRMVENWPALLRMGGAGTGVSAAAGH